MWCSYRKQAEKMEEWQNINVDPDTPVLENNFIHLC